MKCADSVKSGPIANMLFSIYTCNHQGFIECERRQAIFAQRVPQGFFAQHVPFFPTITLVMIECRKACNEAEAKCPASAWPFTYQKLVFLDQNQDHRGVTVN
jgi:hypothetical protein